MATTLRGMTWSHPRGIDPLVACSARWLEQTGTTIIWDARSLQDFESFPVRDLAATYDLLVIDHPHVGQVTAESCLAPLDVPAYATALAAIAAGSVGVTVDSYRWQDRLWALPIDTAAQVQAWRPDLLPGPLQDWDAVLALAAAGQVLCPLRSPHVLMAFFTLAANLGTPCAAASPHLIAPEAGQRVYALLQALVRHIDPACFAMDPIDVLAAMSAAGSSIACAPLTYGYVSYALAGFRPARLAFADIPAAGAAGPIGSTLGGTGIAVSANSRDIAAAMDFAYWVASGPIQSGPYAQAGGQPGHLQAWLSDTVNQPSGGFYRNTLATLQSAWLRPRFDGYMHFQAAASDRLTAALQSGEDGAQAITDLNTLFRAAP